MMNVILYGSQTGNSEQIAKEMTTILEEKHNIIVTCTTLDDFISTFQKGD